MRALLVSYAFPPTGGAGVGRVLKLSKYLPDCGVSTSILTVSNPSVPVTDANLTRDVRDDIEVVRTPTLEPGYAAKQTVWANEAANSPTLQSRFFGFATGVAKAMLVPDPQLLWQPSASTALARRLLMGRDDVVFVSGPPFSQFLLGPLARLRPGCAVVLDYRDEWATYRRSYEMHSGLQSRVSAPLEGILVRSAHMITTATEGFRTSLLNEFPHLHPDRVVAIPNGYDPDDFPSSPPAPPTNKFVITYAGTIFRLTSPAGFLAAVRELECSRPDLTQHLDIRFFGRVVPTEEHWFKGLASVRQLGYVSRDETIDALCRSHLNLCILDQVDGAERIYPAKVFELMRIGRPTLTLSPPGHLTELVQRHSLGPVIAPRDTSSIRNLIETSLAAFLRGKYVATSSPVDIERYDRRTQARQFADVFRRACAHARPASSSRRNHPYAR